MLRTDCRYRAGYFSSTPLQLFGCSPGVHTRSFHAFPAIAVLLLLLVAGCSSSDSSNPPVNDGTQTDDTSQGMQGDDSQPTDTPVDTAAEPVNETPQDPGDTSDTTAETEPDGNETSDTNENTTTDTVTDSDPTDTDPSQSNDEGETDASDTAAETTDSQIDPENSDTETTNSDTNPIETTDTESNLPAEPIGFRGVVYTDTEIEIFWDRSPDESIVEYHIRRDDEDVATLDALSYYDNTVIPATTYEYTLQSVNASGQRSTPVSLFLTTPETSPTINRDNWPQIMDQVTQVTSSELYADMLYITKEIADNATFVQLEPLGFFENSPVQFDPELGLELYDYGCEFEGSLDIKRLPSALPQAAGEFKSCRSSFNPDADLNGKFDLYKELSKNAANPGMSFDFVYKKLSMDNQAGQDRELNGTVRSFSGAVPISIFTDFNFTSAAFAGRTTIDIERTSRIRGRYKTTNISTGRDWEHKLTIESLTIQSPSTGNKPITLSTPQALENFAEGQCFSVGQLKIEANDGSQLLIDANTDDVNTVTITITADGNTSSETIPWPPELAALHITAEDAFSAYAESDPTNTVEPTHQDCSGSVN